MNNQAEKRLFPAIFSQHQPASSRCASSHSPINLKMATRYVQDVSKQTDKVIKNSRKYVI
jgi:hypothetical protein